MCATKNNFLKRSRFIQRRTWSCDQSKKE